MPGGYEKDPCGTSSWVRACKTTDTRDPPPHSRWSLPACLPVCLRLHKRWKRKWWNVEGAPPTPKPSHSGSICYGKMKLVTKYEYSQFSRSRNGSHAGIQKKTICKPLRIMVKYTVKCEYFQYFSSEWTESEEN